MPPIIPVETIKYKLHLKEAVVEALRSVFTDHPDEILANTKVDIEFPTDENAYPAIVVRYFERDVVSAGVGHREYVRGVFDDQPDAVTEFHHALYHGTLEFAVYALSSYDRDLVSDSLAHLIVTADLEGWTNQFFDRFYGDVNQTDPDAKIHYININTDTMQGTGEGQTQAPWGPEDVLVYQTGYRLEASGQLMSLPPAEPYGMIEQVDQYPYIEGMEPKPTGADDPTEWQGESD
jgi:hypothetical protein